MITDSDIRGLFIEIYDTRQMLGEFISNEMDTYVRTSKFLFSEDSTESATVTDCLDELLTSRYAGNVSVTNNGHACQSWSSQTPHRHQLTIDAFFPIDGSVENATNYCRDFDGSAMGRPWCYTTEPDIVWEYCTFSICSGKK